MSLKIQECLRGSNGKSPLEAVLKLLGDCGVSNNKHPTLPLYIFNYEISADKNWQIANESRGLVLEEGTWDIVASSFKRFFNLGEMVDLHSKFDWSKFTAHTKEDGSLILVTRYNGQLLINTRNSYGTGEINNTGHTWRSLVLSLLPSKLLDAQELDYTTFVFELCTEYNQVVRYYPKPRLPLLSIFEKQNGAEWPTEFVDSAANTFGLERPTQYNFSGQDSVIEFLQKLEHEDPTNEGVVLRDINNLRIKCKNSKYVLIHKKISNHILNTEDLLGIYLDKGEQDEILTYFPQYRDKVFEIGNRLQALEDMIEFAYDNILKLSFIETQKDFALEVSKRPEYIRGYLFSKRKTGKTARELLLENLTKTSKVLDSIYVSL